MPETSGYNGAIRKIGGHTLEIGSTGALNNFGTITNSSAGTIAEQVESVVGLSTAAASAVALKPYGLSRLTTTGTTGGRAVFSLPAPTAGVRKSIVAEDCSTAKTAFVAVAAGTLIGTTSSTGKQNHNLTFNDAYEAVELIGGSSKYWFILSNTGSVAVAT